MENVLQELTNLGSVGVSRAIEGYTRWYLVSAIGWLIMGIIAVCGSYKVTKYAWDFLDDDEQFIKYIVAGIIMLVGVIMIIYNTSTIFAPEGYAIHNLIIDLKP